MARLHRLNNRIKESSEIIENIISELRNRMNNQDKKIMDQQVKLEIMELRLARFLQQPLSNILQTKVKETLEHVEPKRQYEKPKLEAKMTETERIVLSHLSEREYTAVELQGIINKTREHTARILNKLFKEGYIKRDDRKKPYIYRIVKTAESSVE